MTQAVVTRSRLPVLALVLGVILIGASFLYVNRDSSDEVEVDLHASWTPQREVTVHWQIGALISGEHFTADDVGQFNLTLRVSRGTELVVLAEQGTQGGFLECQISVEGQGPVRDFVDNGENCRVDTVAA